MKWVLTVIFPRTIWTRYDGVGDTSDEAKHGIEEGGQDLIWLLYGRVESGDGGRKEEGRSVTEEKQQLEWRRLADSRGLFDWGLMAPP